MEGLFLFFWIAIIFPVFCNAIFHHVKASIFYWKLVQNQNSSIFDLLLYYLLQHSGNLGMLKEPSLVSSINLRKHFKKLGTQILVIDDSFQNFKPFQTENFRSKFVGGILNFIEQTKETSLRLSKFSVIWTWHFMYEQRSRIITATKTWINLY